MEGEEIYNTTDAQNVISNFKTRESQRDLKARFGMNMYGKDKLSAT
jgi:hypothetical protein